MSLEEAIARARNACNATATEDVTPGAAQTLTATPVTSVTAEKTNAELKNAPACTAEWLRAQGVEPLRDDVPFIERHLPRDPKRRGVVLWRYVEAWHEATDAEPVLHRKANAGTQHANARLREDDL